MKEGGEGGLSLWNNKLGMRKAVVTHASISISLVIRLLPSDGLTNASDF